MPDDHTQKFEIPQKQHTSTFDHIFLEHPREAGEGYFEHLAFTLKQGAYIVGTGVALVLHGLFPCTHQTTASTRIFRLYALFKARREKSYGIHE